MSIAEELRVLLSRTGTEGASSVAPSEIHARVSRAAMDLFAEHGFDGTATREIAEKAGVTEKTLFRHFRNKSALFAEVVYPAFIELTRPFVIDDLQEVLRETNATIADVLRNAVANRVLFAKNHPAVFKLIAQEFLLRAEFRRPFVEMWQDRLYPDIARVLTAAADRGIIRMMPVDDMIRALVSLTVGYIIDRTILRPSIDRDDEGEVAAILGILLHGIAGRNFPQ